MAAMPTNVIVGGVYFVQLKPDNQYGINLTAESMYCMHVCNTSYYEVTCLCHALYICMFESSKMHGQMHPN